MADETRERVLYPGDRLQRGRGRGRRGRAWTRCCSRPGPDLRYVTGYDAHAAGAAHLPGACPPAGDPFLVVPRLELPAAQASPAGQLDLEIVGWDETDDPYALVAGRLGPVDRGRPGRPDVGADGAAAPRRAARRAAGAGQRGAARRCGRARTPAEVAALLAAGEAIDRVHARVPGWLRPGRTEREVAADISDAILAEGHAQVDFAIVASGPNARQPAPRPPPTGCCSPATPSWSTSAAPCRAATARTAPGPTRSARRRRSSPRTTRC